FSRTWGSARERLHGAGRQSPSAATFSVGKSYDQQVLSPRERPPHSRRRLTSRIELPRREYRIFANLTLQHAREQPRLNLQQPPVAYPVVEQRVRHQRVHPQLVRTE